MYDTCHTYLDSCYSPTTIQMWACICKYLYIPVSSDSCNRFVEMCVSLFNRFKIRMHLFQSTVWKIFGKWRNHLTQLDAGYQAKRHPSKMHIHFCIMHICLSYAIVVHSLSQCSKFLRLSFVQIRKWQKAGSQNTDITISNLTKHKPC